MTNEINLFHQTGFTAYAVIFNSSGQVWNTATSAFEAYSGANWTSYDISLTEQGISGVYLGDFPTSITASGTYDYYVYRQVGGSPAQSDTRLGAGKVDWTGSADASGAAGSMTGSDWQTYVLGHGFKRTDKDTQLYEATTDIIQDLRRRYHFDEAETETTTTDTITTDGDFKMTVESDNGLILGIVVEDDDDAWPLNIVSKHIFDEIYPDINVTGDRGIPTHATIYNGQIYIGLIPDKTTYEFRISYSKRAGTVTSSTTAVPFTNLYRDMLLYGVLFRLYEGLGQFDLSTRYKTLYEEEFLKSTRREDINSADHVFTVKVNDL